MMEKIVKSDEAWRAQLTPLAFRVTRRGGTEPPFSGRYNAHKASGVYHCVCCDLALFSSEHKFDSGTGWPSYYQALSPDVVTERTDRSFLMRRTEVLCARCDAHLGHVFPDGPRPTGQRYCMNAAALQFKTPRGELA